MTEQTQEQKDAAVAELNTRVKAFNEELIPLLGKHKLGLGAVAFITTDGRVGARPNVFDDHPAKAPAPENTPADNAQSDAPAPTPAPESAPSVDTPPAPANADEIKSA